MFLLEKKGVTFCHSFLVDSSVKNREIHLGVQPFFTTSTLEDDPLCAKAKESNKMPIFIL
jgi:hypothetical protein